MYGKLEFLKFDQDDGSQHELRLNSEFFNLLCPLVRGGITENALYWYVKENYVSTVTCVRRTKEENTAVGGFPLSGHLQHTNEVVYAVDLRTRDMQNGMANQYAARLELEYSRAGIYVIVEKDHVHTGLRRAYQFGDIA